MAEPLDIVLNVNLGPLKDLEDRVNTISGKKIPVELDTSKFKNAEGEAEKAGKNSGSKYGGAFSTASGIAIAAGAAAIVGALGKAFTEFDKTFSDFQRQTGVTGQKATDAFKPVLDIAKKVSSPLSEVAAAYNTIGQRTDYAEGKVKDLVIASEAFGKVSGTGLKEAADFASTFGVKLKLSASETTDELDRLYKIQTLTGRSAIELGKETVGAAGILKEYGFTLQGTEAIVGKFAKGQQSITDILPALQKGFKTLAPDGNVKQSFENLSESIKAAKDNGEALGLVGNKFGKDGLAIVKAIRNGRFDVEDFNREIGLTDGLVKSVAEKTETFAEAVSRARNVFLADLGPALQPLVKEFADTITESAPMIAKLVTSFASSGISTFVTGLHFASSAMNAMEGPLTVVSKLLDATATVLEELPVPLQLAAAGFLAFQFGEFIPGLGTAQNIMKSLVPGIKDFAGTIGDLGGGKVGKAGDAVKGMADKIADIPGIGLIAAAAVAALGTAIAITAGNSQALQKSQDNMLKGLANGLSAVDSVVSDMEDKNGGIGRIFQQEEFVNAGKRLGIGIESLRSSLGQGMGKFFSEVDKLSSKASKIDSVGSSIIDAITGRNEGGDIKQRAIAPLLEIVTSIENSAIGDKIKKATQKQIDDVGTIKINKNLLTDQQLKDFAIEFPPIKGEDEFKRGMGEQQVVIKDTSKVLQIYNDQLAANGMALNTAGKPVRDITADEKRRADALGVTRQALIDTSGAERENILTTEAFRKSLDELNKQFAGTLDPQPFVASGATIAQVMGQLKTDGNITSDSLKGIAGSLNVKPEELIAGLAEGLKRMQALIASEGAKMPSIANILNDQNEKGKGINLDKAVEEYSTQIGRLVKVNQNFARLAKGDGKEGFSDIALELMKGITDPIARLNITDELVKMLETKPIEFAKLASTVRSKAKEGADSIGITAGIVAGAASVTENALAGSLQAALGHTTQVKTVLAELNNTVATPKVDVGITNRGPVAGLKADLQDLQGTLKTTNPGVNVTLTNRGVVAGLKQDLQDLQGPLKVTSPVVNVALTNRGPVAGLKQDLQDLQGPLGVTTPRVNVELSNRGPLAGVRADMVALQTTQAQATPRVDISFTGRAALNEVRADLDNIKSKSITLTIKKDGTGAFKVTGFAKGGLVTQPTLGVFGEGRSNGGFTPEALIPKTMPVGQQVDLLKQLGSWDHIVAYAGGNATQKHVVSTPTIVRVMEKPSTNTEVHVTQNLPPVQDPELLSRIATRDIRRAVSGRF